MPARLAANVRIKTNASFLIQEHRYAVDSYSNGALVRTPEECSNLYSLDHDNNNNNRE